MIRSDELYIQVICPRCNAYKNFWVSQNLEIKGGDVMPADASDKPEKRKYGFFGMGNLICRKCGQIVGMYVAPTKRANLL